jgi:hypothetical protein
MDHYIPILSAYMREPDSVLDYPLVSNLLIPEAAETVLGYFGFDRNLYSDKKNISKRKWWWFEERHQNRDN